MANGAAGMHFDSGEAVAATGLQTAASCDDIFKVCLNSAVGAELTEREREALEVFLSAF